MISRILLASASLKKCHFKFFSTGFIYGVPPRANEIYQLSVVATNRETFETGLLNLTINVTATTQCENLINYISRSIMSSSVQTL